MAERTNDEWLADLTSEGPQREAAIEDLRSQLERRIFYYLRSDRSDMSSRPTAEVRQMAQDFAQDALLKVLDNLSTFRGESRFLTWATKIATRVAISELRRARWRNVSLDLLTADGDLMPGILELSITPDASPDPERSAERQEVLRILDDALENVLTERQRIAISAYMIEGMNVEEIARRLGSNRNAIYKVVHDARVKLKRYLEEQGLSLDYILGLFGRT